MGVDFYTCDSCGNTFPDCGDYTRCHWECGRRWCDDKCAKEDGYKDEGIDEGDGEGCSCGYCRNECFTDHELLNFLLCEHDISREQLVEDYKKTL